MKSFDDKWNEAAGQARENSPELPEVPLGFATRVAALSRAATQPIVTWLNSFERYVFKMVAVVAIVAFITGGFVVKDLMATPSIVPTFEEEIAEQFPLL